MNGRLAAELAADRKGETAAVISALRKRKNPALSDTDRIPASIDKLAEDYSRLADEVVTRTTPPAKKRGAKK